MDSITDGWHRSNLRFLCQFLTPDLEYHYIFTRRHKLSQYWLSPSSGFMLLDFFLGGLHTYVLNNPVNPSSCFFLESDDPLTARICYLGAYVIIHFFRKIEFI